MLLKFNKFLKKFLSFLKKIKILEKNKKRNIQNFLYGIQATICN